MAISISSGLRARVSQLANEAGFDAVRLASASDPWDAGVRLAQFVEAGHHGTMGWMATTLERRAHPVAMWADAKTAVMLGVNYGPSTDPMTALERKSAGNISVYARGDDYHDVIKKRLKVLAGALHRELKTEVKVFVDTAPLMEKPLAALAGLGWQGKHTNLVSREFGSWLFLGCILLAVDIEPDEREIDHCGSCTDCLDICPTQAFPAPYQLDARRCISYLTIEHAGPIPMEFRTAIGNRIYGCDDCLAACPWNKFASESREVKLIARAELESPRLAELANLDDANFRALFAKNPIKRIGVVRFLRNVAIAIGNSGDLDLVDQALMLARHESALVRGGGVWALKQLVSADGFAQLAHEQSEVETDSDVRSEWGVSS